MSTSNSLKIHFMINFSTILPVTPICLTFNLTFNISIASPMLSWYKCPWGFVRRGANCSIITQPITVTCVFLESITLGLQK